MSDPSRPPIIPLSMRYESDRVLVRDAFERAPFVILKANPSFAEMTKQLLRALDCQAALDYEAELGRSDHLVRLSIVPGTDSSPPTCPDSEDFTSEFWSSASADDGLLDQVRWIFDEAGCRSVHIYLNACATQRLIHRMHPSFEELLRIASRSLAEGLRIVLRCYRDQPMFIADLGLP